MTFDPNSPEIALLMHRKAEAQTRALIEADERLQTDPNMDPARLIEAKRAADPTSILEDDDLACLAPAFPEQVEPIRRLGVSFTIPAGSMSPDLVRLLTGAPNTAAKPDPLAAAFAPVQTAFKKVVDHFNTVMQAVGDAFGPFMDKLNAAAPDSQQLRHGAAAVCPKHGPTKGGLCRRCVR